MTAKSNRGFQTMKLAEVAAIADHMRNYRVTVSLYGFKSCQTTLAVHVGLASTNHLETIKSLVAEEYAGGHPQIIAIEMDVRQMPAAVSPFSR